MSNKPRQDLRKLREAWAEADKKARVQEKRAANARGRADDQLETIKAILQSQLDACVKEFNSQHEGLIFQKMAVSQHWLNPNSDSVRVVVSWVTEADDSPFCGWLGDYSWTHPDLEALEEFIRKNVAWKDIYELRLLIPSAYYDSDSAK